MPVKFIGASPDGRHAFVTLANVLNSDLQPIVSSYFCKLNARHITLDWAWKSYETGQSLAVIDCGRYVDEATYDQCLNFVGDIRYIKGDHNALPSCKDLVYDFTEYTDNDVCLGFTKRKDFRKEERKNGALIVMRGSRQPTHRLMGRSDDQFCVSSSMRNRRWLHLFGGGLFTLQRRFFWVGGRFLMATHFL